MKPSISEWGHHVAKSFVLARFFFLTCVGIFISAGEFFYQYGNIESFKVLNRLGSSDYDIFFVLITQFGDSLLVCALISILFARKYPLEVLTCWIVVHFAGLIVQLLKHLFFEDWGRPGLVLGIENIYAVGTPEIYHTFPSGHACTAFITAFWVATVIEKKFFGLGILAAIIAGVIAYSRIYLGVHFLRDILAGGIIGITIGTAIYSASESFFRKKFHLKKKKVAKFLIYLGILGLIISIIRFFYQTKMLFFEAL